MFMDVNIKVRQHCLTKFCMEDSSKPSVIHGRLMEYNMDIIQCQNQNAQVICCFQGQLWHRQQLPSWSVSQSTISFMVCNTANNLPHFLWHKQQPSWSLTQSISFMVCVTVNNLPQGLCHSQQPPSGSVPHPTISHIFCDTISNPHEQ